MKIKGLFFRARAGGQSVRVSPGDALWNTIAAAEPERRLGTRELAAKSWSVSACANLLARGLGSVEFRDEMAGDGNPPRGNRVSALLTPHRRRIAKDLAVHGEAVLVIVSDSDDVVTGLLPVRPDDVTREDDGRYAIGDRKYEPAEILHVADELPATAPVEQLRALLEEDLAAIEWRRKAWKFAPRGIMERPLEAPEWSNEARERFIESFAKDRDPGRLTMLEEGMKFSPLPLPDAQAAEFVSGRKLVADAAASLYGIPGVLLAVGADRQLGVARRQLIAGPVADYAALLEQAAADQLAPLVYGSQAVNGRIRPVADIAGALRREDEDSGVTLGAVGGPFRTPNEQRAAEGRAPIAGGDALYPVASKTVVTE